MAKANSVFSHEPKPGVVSIAGAKAGGEGRGRRPSAGGQTRFPLVVD